MKTERQVDIDRLFEEGTEIDEALGRAALQAREAHVKAGLPLPVWRDGKTVWLGPEEIDGRERGARRDPGVGTGRPSGG